jgi:hypothetical protein
MHFQKFSGVIPWTPLGGRGGMGRGGDGGAREGGERAGNCPGLGQQNYGHLIVMSMDIHRDLHYG